LRVDRKLRSVLGAGAARWLSTVGNASLALGDRGWRGRSRLDVAVQEGPCGDEFTALAAAIGGRHGVCVQRTAEYLNWRYLGSTERRHEMLVARSQGVLRAYAVVTREGEDATLVDLFGDGDRAVTTALVAAVTELLRARSVMTLSAPVSDGHPLVGVLPALGFRPRERAPLIVYTGRRREPDAAELDASRWCLTHGDRDS
jgi:hypothetical protein